MRNSTRELFNAYLSRQATLNGISSAAVQFAVEPTISQKLEDRIREDSGFLQQINIVEVPEMKGQKLGLDVSSPIASRTDTNVDERTPTDPTDLGPQDYECSETDFDTFVTYQKLDMWAKFPDFQTRLRNAVTKQQARDRIMIGFNGTSIAATSNLVANPKLQDVNIGWLQEMRTHAPERVLDAPKIGDQAGSDYKNIDAAVMDATNNLIADWFADDTDLVAIVGRNLVSDKYVALANDHNAPTEKVALDTIITNKQIGGKKAIMVPFFPANAAMITKLSNLSIYHQEGTRRRHIKEEPEKRRIVDYQSVREDYVVEDFSAACLIENISVPDGADGWT